MDHKILLITAPFTQLNTPYPATAYLKGYLDFKKIPSFQVDLGLEVLLKVFSKKGLYHIFKETNIKRNTLSENAIRILALKKDYISTIEDVISFLQGKNEMLSHTICNESFLPQASRFNDLDDLEWAFGSMGIRDKARHLCTLYLEDLCDFIIECIDPHFGFSRYAERISSSAFRFDTIHEEINKENSLICDIQNKILNEYIEKINPSIVAFSVPFPGNLLATLKCGQYIKATYPNIKITIGGGYPNTELRSLSDSRIFEFIDFITLDDGEVPLLHITEFINGERTIDKLKRTLLKKENKVIYMNGSEMDDFSYKNNVSPSYEGLKINDYISIIDIVNPMHRLWSDGFWNKLTMAHGCYWGKCSFCDTSLDYIKRFEPASASVLCNKVEEIIKQTGKNGFHFVDEAAPPSLMIAFAKEIIKREINIVWWTNIRFERHFTYDVCRILKTSGCIAVSGGLEVASDRVLSLINKGVSVSQVAQACYNFASNGILTHAYLMYGFPTQSTQETIDSLEIVRQMFENNILHSGFWHQFALTVHSPVAKNLDAFNISTTTHKLNPFANNDLEHIDKKGAKHELFSDGLKKSIYNYMHDLGFDLPLQEWFDFKIPPSTIAPDYIYNSIEQSHLEEYKPNNKVIWINEIPEINLYSKKKKGNSIPMAELSIHQKDNTIKLNIKEDVGNWIIKVLQSSYIKNSTEYSVKDLIKSFEDKNLGNFDIFSKGYTFNTLRECGLLIT